MTEQQTSVQNESEEMLFQPEAKATLQQLEAQIGNNLRRVVHAGQALQRIVEESLYKRVAGAKSLSEYCLQNFGFDDKHAYRLIAASRVLHNLEESLAGVFLPIYERQLRPLTALEPEQQAEAWLQALELAQGSRPRGSDVEQAVQMMSESKHPCRSTSPVTEASTDDCDSTELASHLYGFEDMHTLPSIIEDVAHGRLTSEPGAEQANRHYGDCELMPTAEVVLHTPVQVLASTSERKSHNDDHPQHDCSAENAPKAKFTALNLQRNYIPKEAREDKVGFWKNRALNAEFERDRLRMEVKRLQADNLSLSLQVAKLTQRT